MSLLPHHHDALFKAFLNDPTNLKTFLQEFLPKPILNYLSLEDLKIIPPEKISLSKEKRFIPDLLAEAPFLDRTLRIYILIEHKSTPDLQAYAQIGYYILSQFEEDLKACRKPTPVFPLIYYHGKASWPHPAHFLSLFELPEELCPFFLDYYLNIVDLTQARDEELLAKLERYGLVYGLLWLQKHIWSADLEKVIDVLARIAELSLRVGEREAKERDKFFFGFMVSYVAGRHGIDAREVLIKIMERGGERAVSELKSVWDIIREEALQQGLLLDAQEMVLEALEERFGKVEEELSERIKKIEDRDFLRRLHRLTFKVNSLEEILQELDLKKG
ncbi:MAG: Rpn family recombination-promoting nuclease/putative transposase [Desulfurococcaceae archaeon]